MSKTAPVPASSSCWKILKKVGKNKYAGDTYLCQCRCGSEKVVSARALSSGKSTSCGCAPSSEEKMRKDLSRIGYVSGRLKVVGLAFYRGFNPFYECECSCGRRPTICGKGIFSGKVKACGCVRAESLSLRKKGGFEGITGSYWYTLQKDAQKRGHTFNLSIEFVWSLFLKQSRKCAITGLDLTTTGREGKDGTGPKGKGRRKLYRGTASLDRIDSGIGYIEGNVWWVHEQINLMKNVLPLSRFLALCHLVSIYQGETHACGANFGADVGLASVPVCLEKTSSP